MKNISHDEFGIATSQIGSKVHPFELAGLGKAPFKYVGFEHRTFQTCHGAPVQVGGSCQYCSTGISNFFFIESSDGKKFHVGSECVKKTGDKALIKIVNGVIARNNAIKKQERDTVKINAALETLKLETVRSSLSSKPHPTPYLANQGNTLLDYVEFCFKHAGNTGKVNAACIIERNTHNGSRPVSFVAIV
jgi:hypothetical protein